MNVEFFKSVVAQARSELPVFIGSNYSTALDAALNSFSDNEKKSLHVTYYEDAIEPLRSTACELSLALQRKGIKSIPFRDSGLMSWKDLSTNQIFSTSRYRSYHLPDKRSSFANKLRQYLSTPSEDSLALQLLRDYLVLGESAFTTKYADQYINQFCSSPEHRLSLQRLRGPPSGGGDSFFQGEVFSGLISPLIAQGELTPSQLLLAAPGGGRVASGGLLSVAAQRPLVCRMTNEAIRKDWHFSLARSPPSSSSSSLKDCWTASYRFWRGFVQRDAYIPYPAGDAKEPLKPALVLIHGFGGSIDQYSGLAKELSSRGDFEVFALDLLGFGHSEKPPLSYDQYLWRDQVIDYINLVVAKGQSRDVLLAGNSIGGFIAASVAAQLASLRAVEASSPVVRGLILFNPSGKVLPPSSPSFSSHPSPLSEQLFPPFRGPASQLLRLVGQVIFSLLQPRIQRTCEWLYPSRPQHVSEAGLATTIYRDSCDPGARDVIASGGE